MPSRQRWASWVGFAVEATNTLTELAHQLRVAFFYPLPLGLQQPQAVPWAQEYVVYMYGSDAANGTGANLNGHC